MASASRHLNRVFILQTLFAYEFKGDRFLHSSPGAILEYVIMQWQGKISELTFARELLQKIITHRDAIRDLITRYAPSWPIDKIAGVDRAILEIGIAELLYGKDVPAAVVIDEAIELAKSFGNENSSKFVNGVLNAVLQNQSGSTRNSGEKN